MSHSLAFINEMKHQLEQELETIEADLEGVAVPDRNDHVAGEYAPTFHHSDEEGDENSTRADDLAEHAVNVDVTLTLEQQEERVQKALMAIEDGEYGICATCGAEISEERLRANPSADLCMSCAQ